MIRSLIYVSQSTLIIPRDEARLDDIVTVATSRNARLGVTGALMFTQVHFAQMLEGEDGAIDALMTSIRSDDRHFNIKVVQDLHVGQRSFPTCSLAYAGPELFVGDVVGTLVRSAKTQPHQMRKLMQMMVAFAR